VCIGDFNSISEVRDKYEGSQTMNVNNKRFKEFLFDAKMIDLGFKGSAFTWTNRPHVSSTTHVRLDRALANVEWCNNHLDAYVNYMHRIHSDHCPILLRTKGDNRWCRSFRLENWWLWQEGL
jgi:exonuclease III